MTAARQYDVLGLTHGQPQEVQQHAGLTELHSALEGLFRRERHSLEELQHSYDLVLFEDGLKTFFGASYGQKLDDTSVLRSIGAGSADIGQAAYFSILEKGEWPAWKRRSLEWSPHELEKKAIWCYGDEALLEMATDPDRGLGHMRDWYRITADAPPIVFPENLVTLITVSRSQHDGYAARRLSSNLGAKRVLIVVGGEHEPEIVASLPWMANRNAKGRLLYHVPLDAAGESPCTPAD